MNWDCPLISILVPVYGVEKYIERCARSIFEQTYTNLEILFLDDCSPDKSMEILEMVMNDFPKWKQRTRILRHRHNRGLAMVRNTLVYNSTGEFLIHIDSDDWLEPNAVELLVKRQKETNADIVTGMYCRHDKKCGTNESIRVVTPWKVQDKDRVLESMLKCGSVVATWNRLIRSTLYRNNNIQYVEGIDAGEDLLITPRLVYYSQILASCNYVTYHYSRNNPSSYVNLFRNNWDMQLQLIQACKLNVDFFSDKTDNLKKASKTQFVERLKKILNLTLKNHNRKGYSTVIAMLDNTDRQFWPLLGWDIPHKMWIDHHYMIATIVYHIHIMCGKISLLGKKNQKIKKCSI